MLQGHAHASKVIKMKRKKLSGAKIRNKGKKFVHAARTCPCCMPMSFACPCPNCMSMSLLHVHVSTAWTRACSIELDMQHARTWKRSMDMDKLDIQHGHGHAAWS
jgi:hypothetical protein